jgi:chromosome condensin MukBEF ATPase and DNA-binding subunit MukB
MMILKKMKLVALMLFLAIGSTTLTAQVEQTTVSDEEISKFAVTFQKMRMINQQMQMEMTEVVSNGGMKVARFNEIHTAKMNPEAEIKTTDTEEEQYQKIITEIAASSQQFQQKMENTVREGGLSLARYEQIVSQLDSDPALQERLKAEFQN